MPCEDRPSLIFSGKRTARDSSADVFLSSQAHGGPANGFGC